MFLWGRSSAPVRGYFGGLLFFLTRGRRKPIGGRSKSPQEAEGEGGAEKRGEERERR